MVNSFWYNKFKKKIFVFLNNVVNVGNKITSLCFDKKIPPEIKHKKYRKSTDYKTSNSMNVTNLSTVLEDGKESVRLLSGSKERCATGQNKGN